LADYVVLEVGVELLEDVGNLGYLVVARLQEHLAPAVPEPFGVNPVGVGQQLDNSVVERLAAFFQRGYIAFGDVYLFAELFLGKAKGAAKLQKTAADGLIHCYSLSEKRRKNKDLRITDLKRILNILTISET